MTKGEIYEVESEGDPQIHGSRFELLAEESVDVPGGRPRETIKAWAAKDVATGEVRHFLPEHFGVMLRKVS